LRFPILRPFDWTQGRPRSGRCLRLLGIFLDTQLRTMYNTHLTNRGFLIWRTKLQLKRPSRRGRDSAALHFALCTCLHPDPLGLIFAFSTYLSCHEFIASEPPFLSMDYFSVFSAFSVAISFVPSCLSGHESIMQNKANVKIGKITVSPATLKAYANEQRTMNKKRYPKQTQSNPISNAQTPYPACRTRVCRGDEAQVHNPYPHLFP